MSDDEVEERVERRSMVGAPPSAKRSAAMSTASAKTPVATRSVPPRTSARSAAKRRKEESGEESNDDKAQEESDDDDGSDDDDALGKPKNRRGKKKRRMLLTDSVARKKRNDAKKAAAKEARIAAGEPSPPPPEKIPTPEPEEPEPEVKVPTIAKYSPLQLMCDHLLRKIQAKDPDEYFAFAVTPLMAPDYHQIITQPMDFGTMREKIEGNLYTTIPEMRVDAGLIVTNALAYNNPNTVYHLAATRLAPIMKYYFSEQYLRYIFHTLPFANQVPLEAAGLSKPLPVSLKPENKRRLAVGDVMTPEDCKNVADPKVKDKLATRLPSNGAKLAFIDNKDGATVLNVIGENGPDRKTLKLGEFVGPLEEGTPGLISLGDHRLSGVTTVNYLDYGSFCSFAPQYDSTWASLTKRDSDLLLRTYGDRTTVAETMSLRNMVLNAGPTFLKYVDDMLDGVTDGEHSRTMAQLEKRKKPQKTEIADLLADVETLENLGVDVGFVQEIRMKLGIEKENSIRAQLNATGRAVVDLAQTQDRRLVQRPPITLTKAAAPTSQEMHLAQSVQQQLVSHVQTHASPSQVVSSPAIHYAIGMQQNNELDMDILGEFFEMEGNVSIPPMKLWY